MGRQGEIRERIRASLEKYISASGYTQKEIAEKLGVSKSSISASKARILPEGIPFHICIDGY